MSSQGIDVGEPHPTGTGPRGWARSKLFDLLDANSKEFDEAFDAFLAADAQVTVNGEVVPREEYKQKMRELFPHGGPTNTTIRFDAEVEEVEKAELDGDKVSELNILGN